MKHTTADRIEEILGLSYGQRFNPGLVTMLEDVFKHEDDYIVEAAVSNCIRTCQHPPSVAEIQTEVANVHLAKVSEQRAKKQKEYAGPKPDDGSGKRAFFEKKWAKIFKDESAKANRIFTKVKTHYQLNFLHKNTKIRRLHVDVATMGREIYKTTHWPEELSTEEIGDGVIAAIKDRLEQTNERVTGDSPNS